jgi:hypothetical protein
MTPALRRFALLLPAVILLAGAADGRETTIYVQRIVVADAGDISLGDLVTTSGDIGPLGRETLSQSIAVLAAAPFYVPASSYIDRLLAAFGDDAIVVGSRTLVIPRGAVPDGEAFLLDRLADYLCTQGVLGDQKTELRFTQNLVTGTPPGQGTPVFSLRRPAGGPVEVSFSLSGDPGNSVTGRVVISSAASGAGSAQSLKSGTAVQVVFHKGLITIEMPGKTLGAAGVGEKVSILVPDSQRTFTGKVLDGKAVSVELP